MSAERSVRHGRPARAARSAAATVALLALLSQLAAAPALGAAVQQDTTFGAGFRAYDPVGTRDLPVGVRIRANAHAVIGSSSVRPSTTNTLDAVFFETTSSGLIDPTFGTRTV